MRDRAPPAISIELRQIRLDVIGTITPVFANRVSQRMHSVNHVWLEVVGLNPFFLAISSASARTSSTSRCVHDKTSVTLQA
jgi:hypothetical protein